MRPYYNRFHLVSIGMAFLLFLIFKMKIILFIALFSGVLSGCFSVSFNFNTDSAIEKEEAGAKLHHLVLCWLKESGNVKDRRKIIELTKTFMDIPEVIHAEAGQVVRSDREIVDDSFDVGILIVTKDQADLQKYLDHPIHQKAKNEVLLPLVDRILVYDFID